MATAPLPVVMDKACGNAGEKGTAGTILPSSWRIWGGQDLRAFLFGELLKSLRKTFKSMERVPIQKPKKQANHRAMCIGGAAKV